MEGREGPDRDPTRDHRRFTTLEGWKQVGDGLYLTAGSTFASIIANPGYDPEWPVHNDNPTHTRLSRAQLKSINEYTFDGRNDHFVRPGQTGLWPHGQTYLEATKEYDALEKDSPQSSPEPSPTPINSQFDQQIDAPYHVFSKRNKWFLIATIGVAGLFSGLSSNIYLPSLAAIAKVLARHILPF